MQLSRYLTQIIASILALACMTAIGAFQTPKLRELKAKSKVISPQTLKRDLASEALYLKLMQKLPTFGFDQLVSDSIFLRFLQYFGDDEARDQSDYSLSPEYFEIVINRDPLFLEAYFFLSGSTSLYAAMPERSIELMDKGIQSLTPKIPRNSYYVFRYKGTDELLFLGDARAAKQSFTKAAEWASLYPDSTSQDVARFSRKTVEFLSRNPRSKFAQFGAWSMILIEAKDKRTRERVIQRIQSLGGRVVRNAEGKVIRLFPPKVD